MKNYFKTNLQNGSKDKRLVLLRKLNLLSEHCPKAISIISFILKANKRLRNNTSSNNPSDKDHGVTSILLMPKHHEAITEKTTYSLTIMSIKAVIQIK